jgi:two-component system, NarL family, response regulator YdfI
MIRVLIVANSPIVRAGLSALLTNSQISQISQIIVVGNTSNLDTGEIEQLQPDVILLDLSGNSQASVWDKLLQLQQEEYSSNIILLTDELEDIPLGIALRAGVKGILKESSTDSEIIAAVEAVTSGLIVLDPDAIEYTLALLETTGKQKLLIPPTEALTPREIEVLEMLGSGMGNKSIAKSLNISEHTVKFHLSSVFQKLSVSTRTEAVTVGVRLGLILL